ncbi:MAG: hypothetical protein N2691_04695 [Patescibacteria group bacterium]|nr:hypothetical protein [Patescibacteria group bacterium]
MRFRTSWDLHVRLYGEPPPLVYLRMIAAQNKPFLDKLVRMYEPQMTALVYALRPERPPASPTNPSVGPFSLDILVIDRDALRFSLPPEWHLLKGPCGMAIRNIPVQHLVTGRPSAVSRQVMEPEATTKPVSLMSAGCGIWIQLRRNRRCSLCAGVF